MNRSKMKTWMIALCSVLAIILAGALVAIVLTDSALDQIQRPGDPTLSSSEIEELLNGDSANGTGPVIPEEEIDLGDPADTIQGDDLIHILLIGQNAATSAEWKNSDAMILCTINKKTNTITLTSFLRDMYVQIPGYGGNKLNASYAVGGMKLLDECLEQNFGVQVDANVAVNFSGLMKLIDMAGGVKIQLSAAEANCLNQFGNWGITDSKDWKLKAGENTLTPEQAMGYARLQSVGGELERTARQRKVISALLEKAKGMNATELSDMVKAGLSMIATDMTNEEIMGLVAELIPMLKDLEIITQRIPLDGSYETKNVENVGSCAIIDFEENREFLAETLNH